MSDIQGISNAQLSYIAKCERQQEITKLAIKKVKENKLILKARKDQNIFDNDIKKIDDYFSY